ncbi:MAG: cell division/cell wall cluster transcriptional repressor MraZ [Candidatus Yanofskybacteria bacterium CG10_big_fil_rev_8_21_14_0_10_36_16]|uniref:Transcriptional regulator MraZ n=1 Tax=Candidatus Yanofskybacteria bacterium CG10_big_fil_rev_8_21_14_0_10_36_16 TaxID=1975096 RepID=A0A2J0Q7G4_9BACT|nr:MAG: cell division/cell wall cluster transcriptional repressor MraZ [Candidatus Yanofskybacteria bacterium CG10_big_fil_rev_8_21_14_0_10_36_16]
MLIGEYKHTIDAKKRISIPAKLRREIGDKTVLTRGLDNCLFLFPMKEWEQLAEKLGKLPFGQGDTRGFVRLLLSGAVEVEVDQLGRVLIPDYLRDYGMLKKKAIVAGLFNRLEIWDDQRWGEYKDKLEKNSDQIAEKLGELGVV